MQASWASQILADMEVECKLLPDLSRHAKQSDIAVCHLNRGKKNEQKSNFRRQCYSSSKHEIPEPDNVCPSNRGRVQVHQPVARQTDCNRDPED